MQALAHMQRCFIHPADVEVEVCTDSDNKHFIRHNTYWKIAHEQKNPDAVYNCVLENLSLMANNRLTTVKWAGHNFRFVGIAFSDGMQVETVLLPIKMFEDFIRFRAQSYRGEPPDNEVIRLGRWLECQCLDKLLDLK